MTAQHRSIVALFDERSARHDPGAPSHPERPERTRALAGALERRPSGVALATAPALERTDAARAHEPAYLDELEAARGRSVRFDYDTAGSPESVDIAYLAAGAARRAAEIALGGDVAFALHRPPGHHAEADRAMGFCLLSNVAIAALWALQSGGIERVMVLDWDVHHGNGTQHILEERGDVLFCSIHRGGGFYPGTGAVDERGRGAGLGTTVNLPVGAGSGDGLWCSLVREVVVPLGRRFRPQLILVSAGFDAHRDDPLGGTAVTTGGFARMCADVDQLAREACDGRLALILEGGYDLDALADSVLACLGVLTGAARAPEPVAVKGTEARTLESHRGTFLAAGEGRPAR